MSRTPTETAIFLDAEPLGGANLNGCWLTENDEVSGGSGRKRNSRSIYQFVGLARHPAGGDTPAAGCTGPSHPFSQC